LSGPRSRPAPRHPVSLLYDEPRVLLPVVLAKEQAYPLYTVALRGLFGDLLTPVDRVLLLEEACDPPGRTKL
jgi:hypothetical protein